MKDLYLDALRQHQAGNLGVAEELYLEYLKESPGDYELLHLMSILLAQKKDFLNARYYAQRAIASQPNSPTLHNSMGNIMHNLNDHESAIEHYKIALDLQPNNASVHNNLGNVYYYRQELDEAKKHYYKATNLRPNYIDAHYNLGLVLTKLDQKVEAKKHLEEVLHLQADHEHAYSNLGYLYQSMGDFEKAKDHYEKSINYNDGLVLPHHNLGVILINEGKFEGAAKYLKKALELDPRHKEALHNLGAVLLLQGNSQEALPYFLNLSRLEEDFNTFYNLGSVYLNLRLLDEAVVQFKKALKLSPNDFATNANLAAIYFRRQDYTMAEKYYQHALYLHPENDEVKHMLKAIQKQNATSAPISYIKNLFDQYSSTFEEHAEVLEYRAPDILFEALRPELIKYPRESMGILDLGCGTGLSGIKFKHFAKRLIGLDISDKMLEVASEKGIYTDLRLGPFEETIGEFSDLDLIMGADSLVYLGDLSDLFEKSYAALKKDGLFAFTVEINDDLYPYHLQRSVRFAHSERYIKEQALHNHFAILHSEKVVLRKHNEGVIDGMIFVLQK